MSPDWIPHDGGPMPVHPDTEIATRFADGSVVDHCWASAWGFDELFGTDLWQHDCSDGARVTAYRILKEAPIADSATI